MEPVHYLANLTDPRYFGHQLTPQQENEAEQWISVNKPDFLPALLLFKIKDADTFSASMFSEAITKQFTAAKWWRIIESKCLKLNTVPENFYKFFFQLHSVPASSGSIERVFSTFGLVWSKMRNRLGTHKAQKLVKVYRHLRDDNADGWTW